MNSQTGEIFDEALEKAGTRRPAVFDIHLSPRDAEILMEVEPKMRALIHENWRDKERQAKFQNNIEKSKVRSAFFEGAVIGVHLQIDAATPKEAKKVEGTS